MAKYYCIRCSGCGHLVEEGKHNVRKYGTPFRQCPRCGQVYVDTHYVEPGMFEETVVFRKPFNWRALLYALGSSGLIAAFFSGFSWRVGIIGFGGLTLSVIEMILCLLDKPENNTVLYREFRESQKRMADPQYVLALREAGCVVAEPVFHQVCKQTNI